ncbi:MULTISPECIES: DUF4132 domain-containing protein [Actinoplanes]|uniref:DUF4132 domain-containing protein n=1 Tax=Actinoplanes TaxID=1865 RepID=UPI0005F2AEBB|nr:MULTISPECIES: DUF4132 domain-containing protein [Actinoplanes]GLY05448.1 hypothetical protein Acsp01_58270 [Actinoplanes sp. NBRC 101535]
MTPERTLRLVTGSLSHLRKVWPEYEVDDQDLREFTEVVGLVCGWAPAAQRQSLIDSLAGRDLLPEQHPLLPQAVRQAEQVVATVTVLESADADHEQRLAAAREVVAGLRDRTSVGLHGPDSDDWTSAVDEMWERALPVLCAQPAPVRQALFDEWTDTDDHSSRSPRRFAGRLLAAGGLDTRDWLDRVGVFYRLYLEDWAWEHIAAEHRAGRSAPGALALWRRMRFEMWHLDEDVDDTFWPVPNPGEPWADRAATEIEAMPADRRAAWHALLVHCVPVRDQARPSAAWARQAGPLLAAVGAEEFATRVDGWLSLVGAPRSRPAYTVGHTYEGYHLVAVPARLPDRHNVRLLSGLLWARVLCPPSQDLLRHVGQIAERATRKVPGHGPASPKLANAAVAVLVETEHPAAVAQLARLASRLTYKSTLKIVEKGLDARATAQGIAREDVEEMALPGYGLPLTDKLGDYSYDVRIDGVDATVTWHNPAGKPVKAPSAQIRADHAEELKDLKTTVKDIGATLIATRDRLDGLLRRDREWTGAQWRERFLEHPLARTLARRLIWNVDGVAVCWAENALRTVDDTVVDFASFADDVVVRLWHPVTSPSAGQWREFLARHRITQPFKQAHRERYLLTDAERATGTYSNRFAAHIVRQHRLNALLARRGWSYSQMRNDPYTQDPPRLHLPDRELTVELSVAGIDAGDDEMVWDTMATDQLRFLGAGGVPVPLAEIPPVLLSEVMRDADLFVAVAGVGSDPTWFDGGPHGRFRDYWSRASFGDLTPSGDTRREVLSGLIPRLAVADRCTLGEKFLEVRGDLHTYRIHYGSGNILIAPDDRYLCIIPESAARAAEPDVYLPFEGDSRLSEIISKVLLLAADTKIKDPVILHQL